MMTWKKIKVAYFFAPRDCWRWYICFMLHPCIRD